MPLDVSASPLFNVNEHVKNGNSSTDVRILADTLMRFKAVHVDPAEFACLKAIVLFRAGKQIIFISSNTVFFNFLVVLIAQSKRFDSVLIFDSFVLCS